MAPYLEDINYPAVTAGIPELFAQDPSQENVKAWCMDSMRHHASSRERLPYLENFYQKIISVIGTPRSILDLACALDPLGLPWMNLPPTSSFFAYDIHQTVPIFYRPSLSFLSTSPGNPPDILTNIPDQQADCAFFLKEAHRLRSAVLAVTASIRG